MRLACIHIPRYSQSQAGAIYDTHWKLRTARKFSLILDELHEFLKAPIVLELYAVENMIYLCLGAADDEMEMLKSSLYTTNPTCEIRDIDDYASDVGPDSLIVTAELRLRSRDVLPIKNQEELAFDVLSPQIPVLAKASGTERMLTQLVIRPYPDTAINQTRLWLLRAAEKVSRAVNPRFWMKRWLNLTSNKKMADKSLSKLFWFSYRVAAISTLPAGAGPREKKAELRRLRARVREWSTSMMMLNNLHENGFRLTAIREGYRAFGKMRKRCLSRPQRLSSIEVASCWQVPYLPIIPMTAQVTSERGAPPKNLALDKRDPHASVFAHTNFRDSDTPFGIKRFDRRRHFYIVGKSGSGKSCLLKLLIQSDIEHGYGCAIVDPHGDLAEDLLTMIPKHRVKDVVIFDPMDARHPPCFNPLVPAGAGRRHSSVAGLIGALRVMIGPAWTDKTEQLLQHALTAVASAPNPTLLGLRTLLVDDVYRRAVLTKVKEEETRRFWSNEFRSATRGFASEVTVLVTRLDELLATDAVCQSLCQPLNKFDFRSFIDTRKIVLIKISKGLLGPRIAQFFGSLLIHQINEAAMSRADVPIESRQDFYLYVDECQNFADQAFRTILSESRKYKLCLTFANQYLEQLSPEVQQTVFGNVGNLLTFRTGSADAGAIANEFKPRFTAEDIMHLATQEFCLKMSIDGEMQEAFSGRTITLPDSRAADNYAREAIRHSRREYASALEEESVDYRAEAISEVESQPEV